MTENRLDAFIKLGKFLIGTVVLGTAGVWINYHVQQRQIEIKELEQLGKFIEHAIDDNVAVRQRFADYFSDVSRSEKARERWIIYAERVAEEKKDLEEKEKKAQLEKEKKDAELEVAAKEVEEALNQIANTQEINQQLEANLRAAENARSLAEQRAAEARIQFTNLTKQLTYPEKGVSAKVVDSGWVFLGTYNKEKSQWDSTYFDVPLKLSPHELKDTSIKVRTTAINVRSGMPDDSASMAPIIDALEAGATVSVLEVSSWKSTGFYWARVLY